jgi:predicted transcriptional regulator
VVLARTRRQRVEATTEGPTMQTTTIALDEETHWRLRQLALDEKTTARDLIREAIADLLKRRGRK